MPIYQAANQISSLYLGNNSIVAAYKGTELIFSSGLTQNIYVFDTTLMPNESKTIMLQKELRGDTASNPITDWGDGTRDTLLIHTYAQDGTYTVKSKYSINESVDTVEGYKSESYDTNKELSEFETVPIGSTGKGYFKIADEEFCLSYTTVTNNTENYLMVQWGPKGYDPNNTQGIGYITYIETVSEYCERLNDDQSFVLDKTGEYIGPIYFIRKSNYTTSEGCILTPGVWWDYNSNAVNSNRVSRLTWVIEDDATECIGSKDARHALISAIGINQKQNTLKNMYYGCVNLKTIDISNSKNWNFENISSLECMFKNCTDLEWFDISQWDFSTIQNTSEMFAGSSIKAPRSNENSIIFIADDYWDPDGEYLEYANYGSYSHYYKIADGDQIPDDSYLFGAGYVTYYNGVFSYTAGDNEPRIQEDFDPFTYEITSEEQDGVTKEIYRLRIENGSTFAFITRTGFYDSTREVDFTPGIWFYCDTKFSSVHGNIYMGKELCFYGPEGYTITYDPDSTEILESFTVSGSGYYKILEEVPENKYLQGSGVITFYNSDSPDLQSYEFDVGTFTYREDHFGKMYCTINTNLNAGYTLLTITTTGWYPNAGVEFTPGVWVSPWYGGDYPRYFVSITFNGDGEDDWIGTPYEG